MANIDDLQDHVATVAATGRAIEAGRSLSRYLTEDLGLSDQQARDVLVAAADHVTASSTGGLTRERRAV